MTILSMLALVAGGSAAIALFRVARSLAGIQAFLLTAVGLVAAWGATLIAVAMYNHGVAPGLWEHDPSIGPPGYVSKSVLFLVPLQIVFVSIGFGRYDRNSQPWRRAIMASFVASILLCLAFLNFLFTMAWEKSASTPIDEAKTRVYFQVEALIWCRSRLTPILDVNECPPLKFERRTAAGQLVRIKIERDGSITGSDSAFDSGNRRYVSYTIKVDAGLTEPATNQVTASCMPYIKNCPEIEIFTLNPRQDFG